MHTVFLVLYPYIRTRSLYIITYRGETVRNLLPNRTEFVGIRGIVVL